MPDALIKYKDLLHHQLWFTDLSSQPRPKRWLIQLARVVCALANELASGDLTLRAMSLIYTTLISMVPLLAVSFSVLKAFGVQDQVEPFLLEALSPLGPQGQEISSNIIGFIDNMNVGVLGAVGLGILFYTVISLVQKIEETFNHIWHIDSPRSMLRRITDYLSVIMIGPVMVVSALALTASMVSSSFVQYLIAIEPFGTLFYYAGLAIPYVLIIMAFTFMYLFIPNTRVKALPAILGATVAGVLWKVAGIAFASFAAGSTQYDAIYSSFAILIMFMIWIYLSWLIFLVGSQIAFYIQQPEYVHPAQGEIKLSNRQKEKMTLTAMYWIAKHYYEGKPAWTLTSLNKQLGAPSNLLSEALNHLIKEGLLLTVTDQQTSYIPAKDLGSISLGEVLDAARKANDNLSPTCAPQAVEHVFNELDQAYVNILNKQNLRDWVAEHHEPTKC